MNLSIQKVTLEEIQPQRQQFLHHVNSQMRYHARHERGLSDSYLIKSEDTVIGYASIMGQAIDDRDTVFEFWINPNHWYVKREIFARLLDVTSATYVTCQSNDTLLQNMLFEFCTGIETDTALFHDHHDARLTVTNTEFSRRNPHDPVFEHSIEPVGDFVLKQNDLIVATAGYMTYYNPPYIDIYFEVHPDHRTQGLGSYIIQEVKRHCYATGLIPWARAPYDYEASRKTLERAGFRICGYVLAGRCKNHGE